MVGVPLPIVPAMTSMGIALLLFPLQLTVTVTVPPALGVGVITPVDALIVRKVPVRSEVVQFGEVQEALLPLTSTTLADICNVALPLPELIAAVAGLTVTLAGEFGETKKPSQAVKASANAITPDNPIRAILRRFMKFSLRS